MFSQADDQRALRVRYSRLGSEDLEVAASEGTKAQRQWPAYKRCFCCIYIFAACLLAASGKSFLHSECCPDRTITAIGLLACGLFLLNNSNMLVSFWRLLAERERFRRHNAAIAKAVRKQVGKIQHLRTAMVALQALDTRFNAVGAGIGALEKAMQELPEALADLKIEAARHVPTLCRLYVHREKDHLLHAGPKVAKALDTVAALLSGQFADIFERRSVVEAGLEATLFYQDNGGLDVGTLGEIMAKALLAEDGDGIIAGVNEVVDKAHEKLRAERRKALEADPAHRLEMEVEALEAQE
mmetsp:Transcript_43846/g.82235  ORF Transcript_43846/g.82235 Transcript_43846/m.82235 type:complete len:299 (+) Transcript_43846:125-1021(+)